MNKLSDKQATDRLFQVPRRIGWGDCDPAGIIYTPQALVIGFETFEAWEVAVVGRTWYQMNFDTDGLGRMGMPTVRAEVDFVTPVGVDTDTVCELRVEKLGRSSLTTKVVCHDGAGTEYFTVTIVSVQVEKPAFKSLTFPDETRARIEAYMKACGDD